MSTHHISFEKLSQLYDNDAQIVKERDYLLSHIASCSECGLEYRRLGKTLELCKNYAAVSFSLSHLSDATLQKYKIVRRKKLIYKSMPAIAASVIMIVGIGLVSTGVITTGSRSIIADSSVKKSFSDSERVIDIIRNHKAAISQVTDQYVEGTVPLSNFDALRRQLGFRRVAYMLVEETEPEADIHWGSAIEEVGLADGQSSRDIETLYQNSGHGKKYIRFRVFR